MSKTKMDGINGSTIDTGSKIDAIKQIIFGDNIAEYETEFEAIKEDLLQKKHELEALIEETKSEFKQTLDSLSTDVNIRITELEDLLDDKAESLSTSKVDKKLLGQMFTELGERLSK